MGDFGHALHGGKRGDHEGVPLSEGDHEGAPLRDGDGRSR